MGSELTKEYFDTAVSAIKQDTKDQIESLRLGMNTRFDGVDSRLDKMETRLDTVETRLEGVEQAILDVDVRLTTVESNTSKVKTIA